MAGSTVVREERSLDAGGGGVPGVGEVLLAAGEVERPEHHSVAAAKAWLVVARSELASGSGEPAGTASEAATRGLAELGEAYLDEHAASQGIEDDTTLKFLAAEELRSEGSAQAATALTRVLADRIALYERTRSGTN